jgi:hypothetical protein
MPPVRAVPNSQPRVWDPWPNPGWIVLPDWVLTTVVSMLLPGRLLDETSRARDVYTRGTWTLADVDGVEQLLSAGTHKQSRQAGQRCVSALAWVRAARGGLKPGIAWPVGVLVWDPERDGPEPPAGVTPPEPGATARAI